MATVVNTRDVILRVAVPRYVSGDVYSEIDAINATLADIASDNKFTTAERQAVRKEWDIVISERKSSSTNGIMNLVNVYPAVSVESTAYTTAFQTLATYLNGGVAYVVGSLGTIPSPPTWLNDANLASSTSITIVASTFRTNWKVLYDARDALLNKAAVEAGKVAAWTGVTNRPVIFKIRSRGYSDTAAPFKLTTPYGGILNGETDALIGSGGPMYTVWKIVRNTGVASYVGQYDTLSSAAVADTMATQLNAIDSSYIIAIFTQDEPQTNRLTTNLLAAMYRCGASRLVYGSSTQFKYRSAYILIGIPGCGEGNGFEAYSGSVDISTTAWCEASFQVLNGNLIVGSTNYTPKILAGDSLVDPITNLSMSYTDISTKAGQFNSYISWNFRNTTEGWSTEGTGIIGATTNALQVTSSGGDPIIVNAVLPPFSGAYYNIVRARVQRQAGSGWEGILFYTNTGTVPFWSGNFYKSTNISNIAIGQWVVLEWDMSQLTAGGGDWNSSTINRIRMDLGTSAADAFLIDWIEIGAYGGHNFPDSVSGSLSTSYASYYLYSGAAVYQYTGYINGPTFNIVNTVDKYIFTSTGTIVGACNNSAVKRIASYTLSLKLYNTSTGVYYHMGFITYGNASVSLNSSTFGVRFNASASIVFFASSVPIGTYTCKLYLGMDIYDESPAYASVTMTHVYTDLTMSILGLKA